MAPKKRDYAAEYARRKQRAIEQGFTGYFQRRVKIGAERGLTKSQSAGHAKSVEVPASIARLPRTKSNYIANTIKDISDDLKKNPDRDKEMEEAFQEIVREHNSLAKIKVRKEKDKKAHSIVNKIREYHDMYDDDLDFTVGDTP